MSGIVGSLDPKEARDNVVSPSEVMSLILNDLMDTDIVPSGAVVGGADDTQQQAGVVSLMDAGDHNITEDSTLWKRIQIRCMGKDLWAAEQIGRHVDDLLEYQDRLLVKDSENRTWLVRQVRMVVGMSQHFDSSETEEALGYAVIAIARDPVEVES